MVEDKQIGRAIQADFVDPPVHDASVLSRPNVRRLLDAARKQEISGFQLRLGNPRLDGKTRLAGHLELHGLASFLLHHVGACSRALAIGNIPDAKLHQVSRPELAVDAEVEEGRVPHTTLELQAHPDSPNFSQSEGGLLPDKLALVPRLAVTRRSCFHDELL
jgi:hypothetical protein